MSGYILHGEEQTVSLPAARLDKLITRADGDAALLYLFLMRASGGVTPQEIQSRLRWSELRMAAAENTLQQLGLLDGGVTPPEPAEERPVYTTEDVANMLEGDSAFAALVVQVEGKLGKKLKTADLQILAGLYDDLGMPPDVIYLLVNHCVSRVEKRFGEGRRPTLRQIEKEGYYWAKEGLFDQTSAAEYLRQYALKQEQMGAYLRALQIAGRKPVESEEKYIERWIEQGCSPELVALAYDQTILYKKELNWRYLNAILRRWQEQGWRTSEDVERGSRERPGSRSGRDKASDEESQRDEWLKKYIKR
ncbi:MAG: DnaD domain protein [Oscillospiraceae bacterium]|nr:DnaD domain protein [Oscillospiraceae bacterium]